VLDYRTIISLEIEENNIFRPHIKQHAHTVITIVNHMNKLKAEEYSFVYHTTNHELN
jgi:hypothetical protein